MTSYEFFQNGRRQPYWIRPPTKCNCRSQLGPQICRDPFYSFGDIAIFIFEPFGIVVVYLQKHDFEKNAIENFRPFHSWNLTQTTDRRDVLYEVVACLVKLPNKRVFAFQRLGLKNFEFCT